MIHRTIDFRSPWALQMKGSITRLSQGTDALNDSFCRDRVVGNASMGTDSNPSSPPELDGGLRFAHPPSHSPELCPS